MIHDMVPIIVHFTCEYSFIIRCKSQLFKSGRHSFYTKRVSKSYEISNGTSRFFFIDIELFYATWIKSKSGLS